MSSHTMSEHKTSKSLSRRYQAADYLAAKYHMKWLLDWRAKNGYTERMKTLNGVSFNINVNWEEMHHLWKEEQLKVFNQYVDIYNDMLTEDEMASNIHEKWMELNSWQRESSPHLFVSFNELDSDEKEKDLEIVRAIKTFF